MTVKVDKVLDAKGLACPMPIIRTKKTINELDPGQVMEIQATDKGSTADLQAWAKSAGHAYIGTTEEDGVLKHYLRKSTPEEEKAEVVYPHVAELATLQTKVENNEEITILDVREPAEFAFGHIPGAVHIPLGELETRASELENDKEIYVVCRTGNRSGFAAQLLSEKDFNNVWNVVPGMTDWQGPTNNEK